jgi:hypothetical protein
MKADKLVRVTLLVNGTSINENVTHYTGKLKGGVYFARPESRDDGPQKWIPATKLLKPQEGNFRDSTDLIFREVWAPASELAEAKRLLCRCVIDAIETHQNKLKAMNLQLAKVI